MCRKTHTLTEHEQMMKFNRYLLFYGPGEEGSGLKGISSDAPEDVIEEFLDWYRNRNRYESGRLRPKDIVRKSLVIDQPVCRGQSETQETH